MGALEDLPQHVVGEEGDVGCGGRSSTPSAVFLPPLLPLLPLSVTLHRCFDVCFERFTKQDLSAADSLLCRPCHP